MISITETQFWNSIQILVNNFHALNKKIFSCNIDSCWRVRERDLQESVAKAENSSEIRHILNVSGVECLVDSVNNLENERSKCDEFAFIFKLLMKNGKESISGVGLIDFVKKTYTCRLFTEIFFDFKISMEFHSFKIQPIHILSSKSKNFCQNVLKPKLENWAHSSICEQKGIKSLSLINNESYNDLYNKYKQKYSNNLVKIWPECTDPLKYIYEDLAIAAYLVTLWKQTKSFPKAFVDLGCGNGLLVYILTEEGYKGYGYDIRKRKIWSMYPDTCVLMEQTVCPSNFLLPEDVNWIIGNHSDELSAWIPVLAAKHSFNMNYFVLPCCAYELSGAKFQRRNAHLSIYNDFLGYVENVSNSCGFNTQIDRLKIPSTKRIALIGIQRTFLESELIEKCIEIEHFVAKEMNDAEIKLRDKHEAVRNCTQIDRQILEDIVLKIFYKLLEKAQGEWNEGRELELGEIIRETLTKRELLAIKSECGGIKTLLKNRHEIFIVDKGKVKIRKPQSKTKEEMRGKTIKKRNCFFHLNHPDLCPLTEEQCTFIHS